jgi:ATP-dependent exoDNAse (exonuclease V) beta subunit
MASRRHAEAASGCPVFKRDSVLRRPDGGIASSETVSPGLHRFESDPDATYGVVWWDPSALQLDVEQPFGLRRQELIARDVPPEVVAAGQRAYIAWRDSRAAAIEAGARPSLDVRTVSESIAAAAERPAAPVETIALDSVPGGPSGARYGTLVHAVFAAIPLGADLDLIRTVTTAQARAIGATPDEQDGAARAVHRALQHEVFAAARRADAAGRCLRETPVTLTAGTQLIEGVVDFAFSDEHGMTVIDFKTDRAEGERLGRYQQQLALYAEALTRVSGGPVRAVLMKV